MQSKLIHLLGGYTKDEYVLQGRVGFTNGKLVRTMELRNLITLINGVSKQEWIDKVYNEICPQSKSN